MKDGGLGRHDNDRLLMSEGKGVRIMEQWERALLESDIPAVETITQSEFESVIEECDTVPLAVRVVPDVA